MNKLCIVGPDTTRRELVRKAAEGAGVEAYSRNRYEEALERDSVLCVNYRRIIRPLEGPVYVLHDSLLPSYRGCAPLAWQILVRERTGGVTLFEARAEVDTGPVIDREVVSLFCAARAEFLSYDEAYDELTKAYVRLVSKWAAALSIGKTEATDVRISGPESYGLRRLPSDSVVRPPSLKSHEALALVRASSRRFGFPPVVAWVEGATTHHEVMRMVLKAEHYGMVFGRPGQVVEETEKDIVLVCKDMQAVRFVFDKRKQDEVLKP